MTLQESPAAKAIKGDLSAACTQLAKMNKHASALDQGFEAVATVLEQNLQAGKEQQPANSSGAKPGKGFSKSKRAALVLDAMKPVLQAAVDQVGWKH